MHDFLMLCSRHTQRLHYSLYNIVERKKDDKSVTSNQIRCRVYFDSHYLAVKLILSYIMEVKWLIFMSYNNPLQCLIVVQDPSLTPSLQGSHQLVAGVPRRRSSHHLTLTHGISPNKTTLNVSLCSVFCSWIHCLQHDYFQSASPGFPAVADGTALAYLTPQGCYDPVRCSFNHLASTTKWELYTV